MKYLIILILILSNSVVADEYDICDIHAPIPVTMQDNDAFIEISKQFLICIEDRDNRIIRFVQYFSETTLLDDEELSHSISDVTWLRRSPNRKDIKNAGMLYHSDKLLGIAYHIPNSLRVLIVANTPYNRKSHVTLGHEVLHTFLGKYHK